MEITKQAALNILKRIGDAIDGKPDGTFTVSDLVQRVASEAESLSQAPQKIEAKVGEIQAEFAAHPALWFWRGTLAGVLLGAAVVAPIAFGVGRAIAKALGIPL